MKKIICEDISIYHLFLQMRMTTQRLKNRIRLKSLQLHLSEYYKVAATHWPPFISAWQSLTYKTAPLCLLGESLCVWEGACLMTVYLSWCFQSSNSL